MDVQECERNNYGKHLSYALSCIHLTLIFHFSFVISAYHGDTELSRAVMPDHDVSLRSRVPTISGDLLVVEMVEHNSKSKSKSKITPSTSKLGGAAKSLVVKTDLSSEKEK